jgi:hypothetical protein
VTWSDGVPFTARDVAFTLNLIKTHPILRPALRQELSCTVVVWSRWGRCGTSSRIPCTHTRGGSLRRDRRSSSGAHAPPRRRGVLGHPPALPGAPCPLREVRPGHFVALPDREDVAFPDPSEKGARAAPLDTQSDRGVPSLQWTGPRPDEGGASQ